MTDETYNSSRDSDDEALLIDESTSSAAQIEDEDSDAHTDQLVSEIDETRSNLTETVQAIGQKLEPQNVMQQATETVREATIGRVEQMASNTGEAIQQTGGGIVETVRSNPIPAAMTAFGLFLLWRNRQSASNGNRDWAYGRYSGPSSRPDLYGRGTYGYGDGGQWQAGSSGPGVADRARQTVSGAADTVGSTVSGAASTVGDTVSGAAENVGQTVSGAASTVADTAQQVPQRAGEVAERAGSEFERILNENPLAVGAVALAAGAVAGLVLPSTQVERRTIGEARDKVVGQAVDQAESVAHQALDKVEEQAQNV